MYFTGILARRECIYHPPDGGMFGIVRAYAARNCFATRLIMMVPNGAKFIGRPLDILLQ